MNRMKGKSATWGRTVLTVGIFILTASLAFAGNHKISKDLDSKSGSNQVNVIVQFSQAPSARHHKKVLDRGGKINRELGHFRGGAYSLPASEIAELAKDPEVLFISPDRPLRGASTSAISLDYHTDTINASSASPLGLDGTGIGVAIIDSGIAPVADLNANNVVYSQDFTGLGSTVDQYGHGTHVAGIIAGSGVSSSLSNDFYTFNGVASNASLINLRVLDQNGMSTDSEVIAAIQTAIRLKDTYNIKVINLSVSRGVYESYKLDPLCQAVEQAWQAGIVVVVAGGNYGRTNLVGSTGYGTITAPANDPYVITVGAMNTTGTASPVDDIPASYSSKGPSLIDNVVKPDLVAPGNAIISLYAPGDTLDLESTSSEVPFSVFQTNGSGASSGNYFVLSGTSMATPMVAGAAALMLQQNPNLTPDQVKARLMKTAFKNLAQVSTAYDASTGQSFTEQADIFTVGAGVLDIKAALANTDLAPATSGSAVSPTVTVDSNGNVVLVTGASILGSKIDVISWGSSVIWGDEVISWGSSFSSGIDVISWGSSISGGADVISWGSSLAARNADVISWGSSLSLGADVISWGSSTPSTIRDK